MFFQYGNIYWYVLLQDWAVAGNIHHLGLEWHVPSDEEYCLVDRILLELLQPEVDTLEGFMKGDIIDRYIALCICVCVLTGRL